VPGPLSAEYGVGLHELAVGIVDIIRCDRL
jgi:hypothetical protein